MLNTPADVLVAKSPPRKEAAALPGEGIFDATKQLKSPEPNIDVTQPAETGTQSAAECGQWGKALADLLVSPRKNPY